MNKKLESRLKNVRRYEYPSGKESDCSSLDGYPAVPGAPAGRVHMSLSSISSPSTPTNRSR